MAQKYKPSIIQSGPAKCFLCGKQYGLEVHHTQHGRGKRALATEDGLVVWLCCQCHRNLHDKGEHDKELQAEAQRAYIRERIKEGYPEDAARDLWLQRYGKFYD